MQAQQLQKAIESAWEQRASVSSATRGEVRDSVREALNLLDTGRIRVAAHDGENWVVHEWVKKAVLLSFRLQANEVIPGGPGEDASWYDKVPSKFSGWIQQDFADAGIRAVPGCFVRHGSFIAKDAVIMPSFVNIGAHIGEGTMIDSWVTVGSCAQIGKDCHISSNVGIGGVLEPLQANPVIIEDNVFIGGCSEIAEGVIVEKGAVIGMGVHIGGSTKIVDRETGRIYKGRVPAYSVVVSGSTPGKTRDDGTEEPSVYAAVIVKTVDEKTRAKTNLNDLLRNI